VLAYHNGTVLQGLSISALAVAFALFICGIIAATLELRWFVESPFTPQSLMQIEYEPQAHVSDACPSNDPSSISHMAVRRLFQRRNGAFLLQCSRIDVHPKCVLIIFRFTIKNMHMNISVPRSDHSSMAPFRNALLRLPYNTIIWRCWPKRR